MLSADWVLMTRSTLCGLSHPVAILFSTELDLKLYPLRPLLLELFLNRMHLGRKALEMLVLLLPGDTHPL